MNCTTDAELSVGSSEKNVLFEHIMRKLHGELYPFERGVPVSTQVHLLIETALFVRDPTMKHLFALLSLCFALQAVAGEDPPPAAPAKPKVSYYGFTNDIVTNYVTTGAKDLGYVRVTMELMVKDEK